MSSVSSNTGDHSCDYPDHQEDELTKGLDFIFLLRMASRSLPAFRIPTSSPPNQRRKEGGGWWWVSSEFFFFLHACRHFESASRTDILSECKESCMRAVQVQTWNVNGAHRTRTWNAAGQKKFALVRTSADVECARRLSWERPESAGVPHSIAFERM